MNKRGISPIVATVLLVVIAIIIALIIIIWARSVVKESIQKSIAGKNERIENFCSEVFFSVDISLKSPAGTPKKSNKVNFGITNSGNIPIYQMQVLKIDKVKGSKTEAGRLIIASGSLKSGESINGQSDLSAELTEGDKIKLIPVLLGEIKEQKTWHVCDEQFGTEEEIRI